MIKTGGRPMFAALDHQPTHRDPGTVVPQTPSFTMTPNGEALVDDYTFARTRGELIYVQQNPVEGTVAELLRNHIALPYAIGTGDLTDNALGLPVPGEYSKKYPHEFLIRAVVYRDVRDDLDSYHDLADQDNDTEFVAFVTNREIEGVGIDPEENPIGHDSSGTVWGAAEDYRGRWSIETTFRQVKYQFLAKTTSRDLGVRRFYWMLAVLLYNSWAALNLMVQKSVPTISDDRPPVRAKVFLEELAARGRKWPPPG